VRIITKTKTQKAVARQLCISVSALREILSGRSIPNKATQRNILTYVSQCSQQGRDIDEQKEQIAESLQGRIKHYLSLDGHSISSLSRSTGASRRVIRRAASGGKVSADNTSRLLQVITEETNNATEAST